MKRKFSRHLLYILLSIFCLLPGGLILAQSVTIKIIETTDVHGAVFPYDFQNDKESSESLAQAYTYITRERKKNDQEIILLDNGDILQGTPLVYYFNFEKPNSPHIYADVMNFMGYDAATIGNHDIEAGHSVYDKFNEEIKFPWLAANAVNKETGSPYFEPYTVIVRKGIKIAVLGLITPAIPNWLPEKIWAGIEFKDMIETAAEWTNKINKKERPDILVGLFHSGIDYTYGGQSAEISKNENAAKLVAEKVPGFDVVFAGHDHHGWNTWIKNSTGKKVLLLGATSSARDAAVATINLTFDKDAGIWKKNISGGIIYMSDYPPHEEFMRKFTPAFEEVKEYVSKPIGNFTSSISTRESMFGDSPFVDLIHKVQIELTGADISFTAPLSFDIKIDAGEIYVRDMFKLYRYENLLYTMELSGEEIRRYLEYSYENWFNKMKDSEDHLMNFEKDNEGNIKLSKRTNRPELSVRYYNFDSAAGLEYTVDVSKSPGERINIHSISDGTEFIPGKKYTAALNSYRGNGGGGHLTRGAKIPSAELTGRIVNSTDKDLRYYLMKWIEKKKSVAPEALGNWSVIPADWWERGREKDFRLLYGEEYDRL